MVTVTPQLTFTPDLDVGQIHLHSVEQVEGMPWIDATLDYQRFDPIRSSLLIADATQRCRLLHCGKITPELLQCCFGSTATFSAIHAIINGSAPRVKGLHFMPNANGQEARR
jgi:hypothetical protein